MLDTFGREIVEDDIVVMIRAAGTGSSVSSSMVMGFVERVTDTTIFIEVTKVGDGIRSIKVGDKIYSNHPRRVSIVHDV